MTTYNIELSDQELSTLIGAVGAMLNVMGLNVPPGSPAPPEMLELEALQTKLMQYIHGANQ